jgi:ABC-type uncharacterized transport system substrate-binding protein
MILPFAQSAAAHPHVFVDTIVEVVFDASGAFSAVHEVWYFDYEFGDVVKLQADLQGNNNGQAEPAELTALIDGPLSWIEGYNFFTRVTLGGRVVEHLPAETIDIRVERSRLVVEFTLPLAEPVAVTLGAGVDVFDGEFYYDFEFGTNPVRAAGLPATCGVSRRTQENVDPMAVMLLRRLGLTADPAILNDPAAGYAVRLQVDCVG